MDKKKRCCLLTVFVVAVFAAGLIIAALSTTFWVEAYPYRNVTKMVIETAKNVSEDYDKDKFKGSMHFGLFYGKKTLNYGFGSEGRETEFWMSSSADDNVAGFSSKPTNDERLADIKRRYAEFKASKEVAKGIQEFGLFNFGLWVSTLVFAALAIAWAIVVMAFAVLNLNTKPVETVTGPMGLYIWNTFGCFCSLVSVIVFTVMYELYIKVNVLTDEEKKSYWVSKDRTNVSYSFWFMVCSIPCFLLNLGFVYASGTRLRPIKYNSSMNKAPMDGVMMY